MGSLAGAFRQVGLAPEAPAEPEPEAVASDPTGDEPVEDAATVDLTPAAIAAAQGFVNLLGSVKRAKQVLGAEQPCRGYGFGRAQSAIQQAIDRANNPARLDVEDLRAAEESIGYVMATSRARDFDTAVWATYAALAAVTGVQKTPDYPPMPAQPLSDNPTADLEAFPAWQVAYTSWWAGLTEVQQRRVPEKARPEQSDFFSSREQAIRARAAAIRAAELAAAFDAAETYEAAIAGLPDFVHGDVLAGLLMSSKWAWEWAGRHPNSDRPMVVLCAEGAVRLSDVALIGLAERPTPIEMAVPVITAEVQRRWPCPVGTMMVLVVNERRHVVSPEGAIVESHYDAREAPVGRPLPTTSHPEGWLEVPPAVNDGWHRHGGPSNARWIGAEAYAAQQLLAAHKPGVVFLGVTGAYGRHPELGYPRFLFELRAGSGRRSFDIPIWRPREGDGWLVAHFEAISCLTRYQLPVPEGACWLNVKLGQTAKGNPRLEPATPAEAAPAKLVAISGRQMSRGRHAPDGSTVGADAARATGGARVLWDGYVSSHGGGLAASCVVAWIPEGGILPLDDGSGVSFEGRGAGIGLAPEDDPSRQ